MVSAQGFKKETFSFFVKHCVIAMNSIAWHNDPSFVVKVSLFVFKTPTNLCKYVLNYTIKMMTTVPDPRFFFCALGGGGGALSFYKQKKCPHLSMEWTDKPKKKI